MFNKNTIKVSYLCMPNIRSKKDCHNKKILKPKPTEPQKLCNCLIKEDSPTNGSCLTSSTLYQATIVWDDSKCKQKKESVKLWTHSTVKSVKSFNLISPKNDTTSSIEY